MPGRSGRPWDHITGDDSNQILNVLDRLLSLRDRLVADCEGSDPQIEDAISMQ